MINAVDRFLAETTRAALEAAQGPCWPSEWTDCAAQEMVADRVAFHGIAVLLGEAPAILAGWPEEVIARVHDEMRLAALWEEIHRTHLVQLLEQLAQAGITAIVMKGTALAYLLYRDPAARRRGDTDLLVRPGDLAAARRVLARAGCRRGDDPHGLNFQETWLIDCGAGMVHTIDLHWQPLDSPVLQKLLPPEQVWDRRIAVPCLSPHVSAPHPVLMVMHGAINQAWHEAHGFNVGDGRVVGGKRLIWAVDYLRLTQSFTTADWQKLADFCEAGEASAIVCAALDSARRDLGLSVPVAILERLRQHSGCSGALDYIRRVGTPQAFLQDFAAAQSLSMRLTLLSSLAFAPRSHLLQKYPHLSRWPSVLLQLRRYADGIARWRKQPGVRP